MKYLKILIFCAIFFCKSEDSEEKTSIADSCSYFLEFSSNVNLIILMKNISDKYLDLNFAAGMHYNFNNNSSVGFKFSAGGVSIANIWGSNVSIGIYYQYMTALWLIRVYYGSNILIYIKINESITTHVGEQYGIFIGVFLSDDMYIGFKVEPIIGMIGPVSSQSMNLHQDRSNMISFGFVLGWMC